MKEWNKYQILICADGMWMQGGNTKIGAPSLWLHLRRNSQNASLAVLCSRKIRYNQNFSISIYMRWIFTLSLISQLTKNYTIYFIEYNERIHKLERDAKSHYTTVSTNFFTLLMKNEIVTFLRALRVFSWTVTTIIGQMTSLLSLQVNSSKMKYIS